MSRTITYAPDFTPTSTHTAGQLALFDGHRPTTIRLRITGTITLDRRTAIDIASRPLGEPITLTDIIDQAIIVQKTYARPLNKHGQPDPLEQTITLRIRDEDPEEEN